MAVYTEVSRKTLEDFLFRNFQLGNLVGFEGIPEGIQNTNYHLRTEQGRFILTLFERRTPEKDLPYFFDYLNYLSHKGFPCPAPVALKSGGFVARLLDKPAALVSYLPGRADMNPSPARCFAAGAMIARLHETGKGFDQTRENLFSLSKIKALYQDLKAGISNAWPGLEKTIEKELNFLEGYDFDGLPKGAIHTDIFPDNVFFEGNRVTGLIDFYFSCTDDLAYDLAISLGCWCFRKSGALKPEHFREMVRGYESIRPLKAREREALPFLMRRASLSFLLTRVEDVLRPPENILGVQKDPEEFMKILANQQKRRHIKDYLQDNS